MPLTIRRKMILYTVIPVVVVFALLFALGLTQVRDHLNRNAQDLLFEHARHQASRLAVAMSQPPSLAASLGWATASVSATWSLPTRRSQTVCCTPT